MFEEAGFARAEAEQLLHDFQITTTLLPRTRVCSSVALSQETGFRNNIALGSSVNRGNPALLKGGHKVYKPPKQPPYYYCYVARRDRRAPPYTDRQEVALSMRRIIVILTIAGVVVAMIATHGVSASAQSPCPPTGPSEGPATILLADEPVGAGFVCLDEEAQEFFCPPEYKLQLFRNPGSNPGVLAECVEQSSHQDGGETGASDGGGGAELTQNGEQQAEAGEIDQSVDVS
jgi:hypothetical protein